MRTAHFFAGGGGGLYADLILGDEPVFALEWDDDCCTMLRAAKDAGWFPGLHVCQADIRLFDSSSYACVLDSADAWCAGFPCQDVSAAGKGAGVLKGERSGLVRHFLRLVQKHRPKFVRIENSPRIRTRGRRFIIRSLLAMGYAYKDGTLAASDIGAPHDRERWWLLAADLDGLRELESKRIQPDEWGRAHNCASQTDAADTLCARRAHSSGESTPKARPEVRSASMLDARERFGTTGAPWFETEPDVGSLVYGLADGVVSGRAAVKMLGNGQVPLQAALAWKILEGPK